jgi:hypothetical protein
MPNVSERESLKDYFGLSGVRGSMIMGTSTREQYNRPMSQPPTLPPPPPGQPIQYATPYTGGSPCPRCGVPAGRLMTFTWWGGFIGPKILNHHRCDACGYTYNGKTGQPNTTGIVIYTLVGLAIAAVILLVGVLTL